LISEFEKIVRKVIRNSTLIYLLCPKYLSIWFPIYFFKSVT